MTTTPKRTFMRWHTHTHTLTHFAAGKQTLEWRNFLLVNALMRAKTYPSRRNDAAAAVVASDQSHSDFRLKFW